MPGWVLRFLPHALAAIVALIAISWGVHTLREQGRDELRPQVQQLTAALAAERANRKRAEEASNAYQSELASVRARPRSTSPVRLCVAAPSVPGAGYTARGSDGSASRAGGDAGSAGADFAQGADIGPDLRALALEADELNARLRALQKWAAGL